MSDLSRWLCLVPAWQTREMNSLFRISAYGLREGPGPMIRRLLAAVVAAVILTATPLTAPVSAQGPYGDCIILDIVCIEKGEGKADCTIFMICF